MLSVNDYITIAFIASMIVVYIFSPKKIRRTNTLPALVTTIGILGTFVGITIGLYDFNVQDVQNSIPELLGGLKVAFYTSIAGIVLAILIKIKNIYRLSQINDETSDDATIDTIADILKEQNNIISQNGEEQKELILRQGEIHTKSLQQIEKSLVGDGDSTLLTQMQKLRTSLIDQSDELKVILIDEFKNLSSKFDEFSKTLAEQNTEAFIEALTTVIKDFNNKLSEQFGQNFAKLNEAVGKLLDWQENYKNQITELIQRFDTSIHKFENIENGLSKIYENIEAVLELVDELDGFMKNAQIHLKALQDSIDSHAEMASKAKEAFPIIEDNINRLTKDFAESVRTTINENRKSINELQSATKEQSTFVTEHTRRMSETATKVINEMDGTIVGLIKQNNDLIAKQFEQFDKSMQTELSNALLTLGKQLSSLSEKFVSDYTPLTERLREILEIAENGNR